MSPMNFSGIRGGGGGSPVQWRLAAARGAVFAAGWRRRWRRFRFEPKRIPLPSSQAPGRSASSAWRSKPRPGSLCAAAVLVAAARAAEGAASQAAGAHRSTQTVPARTRRRQHASDSSRRRLGSTGPHAVVGGQGRDRVSAVNPPRRPPQRDAVDHDEVDARLDLVDEASDVLVVALERHRIACGASDRLLIDVDAVIALRASRLCCSASCASRRKVLCRACAILAGSTSL